MWWQPLPYSFFLGSATPDLKPSDPPLPLAFSSGGDVQRTRDGSSSKPSSTLLQQWPITPTSRLEKPSSLYNSSNQDNPQRNLGLVLLRISALHCSSSLSATTPSLCLGSAHTNRALSPLLCFKNLETQEPLILW